MTRISARRNGWSDLPDRWEDYNALFPENQIPEYVMANSETSEYGNNAVQYDAIAIYAAVTVGYSATARSTCFVP